MTAQGSLLDDTPPAPSDPTIKDQILAAELWERGIDDWLQRFAGSRKRPEHEVTQYRRKLVLARAIVETLRAVARGERTVAL